MTLQCPAQACHKLVSDPVLDCATPKVCVYALVGHSGGVWEVHQPDYRRRHGPAQPVLQHHLRPDQQAD